MNEQAQILVVDDHRAIREALAAYLKKSGYRVMTADNAAAARKVLGDAAIDLVLLDVMMPGEDGLALTRSLREKSQVPIILVTAMGETLDRIVGLELGADDYIAKPFEPREVLARIKTVLRRSAGSSHGKQDRTSETYHFAGWVFDLAARRLTDPHGQEVTLTTAELSLLEVFVTRAGRVLSRQQLLDLTRGRDLGAFDRAIDNQVSRLRKKIEADPKAPILIKTHWGGGYAFTPQVEVKG